MVLMMSPAIFLKGCPKVDLVVSYWILLCYYAYHIHLQQLYLLDVEESETPLHICRSIFAHLQCSVCIPMNAALERVSCL